MYKKRLVPILLALGLLAPFVAANGHVFGPGAGSYEGAGSIVTAFTLGNTVVGLADNGAVVCHDADGDGFKDDGRGGVCIGFDDINERAFHVRDAGVADEDVAFQVCIDVDGDGFCGGGISNEGCIGDFLFYSHDSRTGENHNPLYVDPSLVDWIRNSCGVQGYQGFIVITCAGVHAHAGNPGQSHVHEVYSGTVETVPPVTRGQGDYCGFPTAAKAYTIV